MALKMHLLYFKSRITLERVNDIVAYEKRVQGDGANKVGNLRTIDLIDRVKWCRRHSNLWSRYYLHAVELMSYYVKLTDEDLSLYLNKIESVGLRKLRHSVRLAIWL